MVNKPLSEGVNKPSIRAYWGTPWCCRIQFNKLSTCTTNPRGGPLPSTKVGPKVIAWIRLDYKPNQLCIYIYNIYIYIYIYAGYNMYMDTYHMYCDIPMNMSTIMYINLRILYIYIWYVVYNVSTLSTSPLAALKVGVWKTAVLIVPHRQFVILRASPQEATVGNSLGNVWSYGKNCPFIVDLHIKNGDFP